MKTEEQTRVIELLMQRLDDGVNVDAGGLRKNPTEVYRCPELAAREWETFFRDYPQVIGMSADLPEPGTFVTLADFGVPVLATRDASGAFRAFVNVCRHRGAMLEGEAKGRRSRFACPFHAWTYSNEGELVADRQRTSEEVAGLRVAGGQLCFLDPGQVRTGSPLKQVGGSGGLGSVAVVGCSGQKPGA